MPDSDWQKVATAIHASGWQLVVAVTGGGSGAVSALLQTPGASRTVLEAVVPYSLTALVDWIEGQPDQACSESTARAMAMAAFMRAGALAPDAERTRLLGVGFTGSLATNRPKRGERRVHLAAQTAERTEIHSIWLTDGNPTRAADEEFSTTVLLWLIAGSCGVPVGDIEELPSDRWERRVEQAEPEWTELLVGARRLAVLKAGSTIEHFKGTQAPPMPLVFPGAFNPPHVGHMRMAAIAEDRLRKPLAWELSVANVDKPPLDFIAIRTRVEALQREDGARPIALTQAPTFREKAELFSGATFVVGADTLVRIAEPRYYGDNSAHRDEAIAEIARRGCRFLVFGREVEGRFLTLGDLNLPAELRRLCDEVPEDQFHEDVSSTELRNETK